MKLENIKELSVFYKYWVLNWLKIILLVIKHGPFDSIRDLRRYPWIKVLLKVNSLMGRFAKGRSGRYHKATVIVVSEIVSGVIRMLEGVFFKNDTLIIHEDMVPPEIITAMGLTPFMAELLGIIMPMVQPDSVIDYIDACENEGIPPDICSLPKSTMGLTLQGHMPPALAIIASNLPCDGGMSSYMLIEEKLELPVIRLDVPYNFYNDRAIDYFSDELKRMITWLEAHTTGKMNWDRLKEICNERNKMIELELDLWDMIRVRPAPMASEPVWLSHLWGANVFPGLPETTKIFNSMVNLCKQNFKEGISALKDERFRALLWNPPPIHFADMFNWAERTYGVSLMIDSMTYNRIPLIDTETPESMLRGLAKTIMSGPMARHTRGPAENYLNDIFHIYKEFDIDMVWVMGHIGCKNTQALNGMLRERCREEDVPLLIIDYDLSDPRIVPREGIMVQVEHFMENIMEAERLDN